MFRSYLTIGWRNLARNRWLAFINIAGLALGITVAMLNGLWVWDELSFNKVHANYDRIAQVVKSELDEGTPDVGSTMQYPAGTELRTTYASQFKSVVRTTFLRNYILSTDEFKKSVRGLFADPEIGAMLSLRMKWGSADALTNPDAVLLPVRISRALFGDANPLGRTLSLNSKTLVTVGGVYEDLPLNSSFQEAEYLASWNLYLRENPWIEQRALTDWRNHFIKIYVEVTEEDDIERISNQIRNLELDHITDSAQVAENPQLFLYPMSRWHLYPFGDGLKAKAEPVQLVALVGAIGAFVLLLACINFMNLSTARSGKRAKEVGIRKTVGSARRQLMGQFLSESFLVVVIAFVTSLLVVALALPSFNNLAVKQLVLPLNNPWFWLTGLVFVVITGLIAGSYPAFFLSSFKPLHVLKGVFRTGRRGAFLRRVLVVSQFTISVVLIICTVVVYQQIQFAKARPVGYSREGLITIRKVSRDFYGKYDVLRTELKAAGLIEEMSESMGSVTEVWSGNNGFDWKGKDPGLEESFGTLAVSHEHGRTVGWTFVKGRDFSTNLAADSNALVINEAAARYMGLEEPVGEPVTWTWWEPNRRPPMHYTIIGVIKDMVMESPYEPVKPIVYYVKGLNGTPTHINLRLNPKMATEEAIAGIEKVFAKIIPSAPFDYKFVDDEFALKFAAEERMGKLAGLFATLAIVISCLGLYGLSAFMAEQRTKEIGIRKVMGASIAGVWRLLSADFAWLVLIACFLAIPFTHYVMSNWLQRYEYRISISLWVFVGTIAAAFLVTMTTVSYQTLKAATANPAASLKAE